MVFEHGSETADSISEELIHHQVNKDGTLYANLIGFGGFFLVSN